MITHYVMLPVCGNRYDNSMVGGSPKSGTPKPNIILVGHFTWENESLRKSPQFSTKLPQHMPKQISKSWLAEFPNPN